MRTTKQDRAALRLSPKKPGTRIAVTPRQRASRGPARTTRLTVSLPTDLINRLRDAVYWTPQLTVTRLVKESIRSTLDQMETTNRSPFPARTQELKPGRPRQTDRLHHRSIFTGSEPVAGTPAETAHVRPLVTVQREEAGRECPS